MKAMEDSVIKGAYRTLLQKIEQEIIQKEAIAAAEKGWYE